MEQHFLASAVSGSEPKRCQAADLRAGFQGGDDGGVIYLSPQASDCVTGGIPTVELVGLHGTVPMTLVAASPTEAPDVVLDREFVVRPDLKPGDLTPQPLGGPGEGVVKLVWHQTDPDSDSCSGIKQIVLSMRVFLPGQTSPVTVTNTMDQQGGPLVVCPSFFQVGRIELDGTSKQLDPPRYWSFTVNAPKTAAVGQTVDFTVTLQNIYYRTLQFNDGCPKYIEALMGPDGWTTGKEWYVLNCQPIGAVQPGASVLLAMKIAIPASAPTGSYSLIWELDTGDVSYGVASATVEVG